MTLGIQSRRGFFKFLAGAIAAPAVVSAGGLELVRGLILPPAAPIYPYIPLHPPFTIDDFSERILGPASDQLAENVAKEILQGRGNNLLTLDMITREAVQLFKNSNPLPILPRSTYAEWDRKIVSPA